MTADSKNWKTSSDDIDLLVLIERGLSFFRRYRWAFILATILGLSLGIFAYLYLPKIYKSRATVHSFTLTNLEQINILKNWNELLKKKEYGQLAKKLNCREDILHHLKTLRADEIQQVFTSNNPHGFAIEVSVTDNAILDEVQNGIVYGFENSEYVNQLLAVRRANLQELIETTSTEIQKLDSTKHVLENIITGKATTSSSLLIDGSSINRQLVEMNEKLLRFREELKFTKSIQVLQGFSKFSKPDGPKLIPWLIIGLLLFLPLAFVYALFSSIRLKLKRRSLQNSSQPH